MAEVACPIGLPAHVFTLLTVLLYFFRCSSYVGRRGGQQVVTLDPWRCLTEVGVVSHELLHVLGFYHEHTRLDRDEFIDVLWNNMENGISRLFQTTR